MFSHGIKYPIVTCCYKIERSKITRAKEFVVYNVALFVMNTYAGVILKSIIYVSSYN